MPASHRGDRPGVPSFAIHTAASKIARKREARRTCPTIKTEVSGSFIKRDSSDEAI